MVQHKREEKPTQITAIYLIEQQKLFAFLIFINKKMADVNFFLLFWLVCVLFVIKKHYIEGRRKGT